MMKRLFTERHCEARAGPNRLRSKGYSIDDFYYLSRLILVKDEKHYDKFDLSVPDKNVIIDQVFCWLN